MSENNLKVTISFPSLGKEVKTDTDTIAEVAKQLKDKKIKLRKKLSETQREIVIDKDKSRCCHELLEWSRVYPFDTYCPMCKKGMEFEDEIIFHKKKIGKK